MNRPLGRIRLLIEEPTITTKRRPPRIDAGGRRLPARKAMLEPAPTIPHAIPMSTFRILKWERWHFNVFSVPKII